jgi:hypothetical protein
MRNPFATVRLRAQDRPWYDRLRHIHPELNLNTSRREFRSLTLVEEHVMAAKSLTRAEAYDLHPDVLDVLYGESMPDGFATADSRVILWSLALVRLWFDRPLLVESGAERMTGVVLHHLLETGGDPKSVAFQGALAEHMAPTYGSSAAMVAVYCPDDIDPLTFVAYVKVCGHAHAENMIRQGVSLEYAAEIV